LSAVTASGVFALAGVAIGGLLNYLATAAIEQRRGRKAMRTSARIVGEEVGTNLSITSAALEVGDWTPVGNAAFYLNAWPQYRQALAEWLPQDQWTTLCAAMRHLQTMDRVHKLGGPDRLFTPNDVAHLLASKEELESTSKLLSSYS
jgi:hypothetical protein